MGVVGNYNQLYNPRLLSTDIAANNHINHLCALYNIMNLLLQQINHECRVNIKYCSLTLKTKQKLLHIITIIAIDDVIKRPYSKHSIKHAICKLIPLS